MMTFLTNAQPDAEETLRIPAALPALPDGAFAERTDLRRVVFEGPDTALGQEAFSGCGALEEVLLPAGLADLPAGSFAGCESLSRIALPDTLRRVGAGAFLACAGLRRLRFPPGLEEIGEQAFSGAGLEEALLPPSVKSVEESAFWDCAALCRAEVPNPACRLGRSVFGCCDRLTEGYIAPGYPPETDPSEALLYTLLWCSCPERHGAEVGRRALDYVRQNEELVMEWVLKQDNRAALSGLLRQGLPGRERLDGYIKKAQQNRQTELTALLLRRGGGRETEEDWTL